MYMLHEHTHTCDSINTQQAASSCTAALPYVEAGKVFVEQWLSQYLTFQVEKRLNNSSNIVFTYSNTTTFDFIVVLGPLPS